jgi:hypothetical protein
MKRNDTQYFSFRNDSRLHVLNVDDMEMHYLFTPSAACQFSRAASNIAILARTNIAQNLWYVFCVSQTDVVHTYRPTVDEATDKFVASTAYRWSLHDVHRVLRFPLSDITETLWLHVKFDHIIECGSIFICIVVVGRSDCGAVSGTQTTCLTTSMPSDRI